MSKARSIELVISLQNSKCVSYVSGGLVEHARLFQWKFHYTS